MSLGVLCRVTSEQTDELNDDFGSPQQLVSLLGISQEKL